MPEVQYAAGSLRGGTQAVYAGEQRLHAVAGRATGLVRDQRLAGRARRRLPAGDYGGGGKPVILDETVRKELFGDDDGIARPCASGRARSLKPKGQAASARPGTMS